MANRGEKVYPVCFPKALEMSVFRINVVIRNGTVWRQRFANESKRSEFDSDYFEPILRYNTCGQLTRVPGGVTVNVMPLDK